MRIKRNQRILLVAFALAAIYWFGLRADPRVEALNQALTEASTPALRDYPYTFRVVRMDGVSAVMGTPRSFTVPVHRMIGAIYPELAGRAPSDPDFVAAEKEMAQLQSEARQIVLDQPGVSGVKWELDQNWLITHNIQIN